MRDATKFRRTTDDISRTRPDERTRFTITMSRFTATRQRPPQRSIRRRPLVGTRRRRQWYTSSRVGSAEAAAGTRWHGSPHPLNEQTTTTTPPGEIHAWVDRVPLNLGTARAVASANRAARSKAPPTDTFLGRTGANPRRNDAYGRGRIAHDDALIFIYHCLCNDIVIISYIIFIVTRGVRWRPHNNIVQCLTGTTFSVSVVRSLILYRYYYIVNVAVVHKDRLKRAHRVKKSDVFISL